MQGVVKGSSKGRGCATQERKNTSSEKIGLAYLGMVTLETAHRPIAWHRPRFGDSATRMEISDQVEARFSGRRPILPGTGKDAWGHLIWGDESQLSVCSSHITLPAKFLQANFRIPESETHQENRSCRGRRPRFCFQPSDPRCRLRNGRDCGISIKSFGTANPMLNLSPSSESRFWGQTHPTRIDQPPIVVDFILDLSSALSATLPEYATTS